MCWQVGFGKGTPSKMLWVDGIDPDIPDASLERTMAKFGKVLSIHCTCSGIRVHTRVPLLFELALSSLFSCSLCGCVWVWVCSGGAPGH